VAIIRTVIDISAPADVCFDLARSVDAHVASTRQSVERAVAGRTSGLLEPGETVTWPARHFGVTQELTSRITAFDRPRHFRDEMVKGAFSRIVHDHYFEPAGASTRMTDVFEFAAPLGWLGTLAERIVLTRYMRQLLEHRNQVLKNMAESAVQARFSAADRG
jgi:ligand-binding SRPBCC domain-containing protein